MRFTLVGYDEELLSFLRYTARETSHQLVAAVDVEPMVSDLRQFFPQMQVLHDWEEFLSSAHTDDEVDFILLGRTSDEAVQEDRLRKLTTSGKPVLAVHPAVDSMLVAYEIEAIRRDGLAQIASLRTTDFLPRIDELNSWVNDASSSPIGRIEQIQLIRSLPKKDRVSVMGQIARDVDLVRAIVGELQMVHALGEPNAKTDPAASLANLGVQLSTASGLITRWSITPGSTKEHGAVMLFGERGKITYDLPNWQQNGFIEFAPDGESAHRDNVDWNIGALLWSNVIEWVNFVKAVPHIQELASNGQVSSSNWSGAIIRAEQAMEMEENATAKAAYNHLSWNQACRALEVTEAVQRSLRRGRQIEVRTEEAADISNFKGIMSSVGCGIILFGMFAIIGMRSAVTILNAAKLTAVADFVSKLIPFSILAVAVVFLVVQVVIKIAFSQSSSNHDDTKPSQ